MQELGPKLKQAEKDALDALMRRGRQSPQVVRHHDARRASAPCARPSRLLKKPGLKA
ncbi:hypothetical protein HMI49_40290 [Corallococcus exercitus]|uniref:Uncharacterized protein n=1 Tax=Corallococcus exercitus TaxID=2316736 RepID=A0A7Y4NXP8_9BACT|nr:hypothetical protein [Corallococcus exercitus]